MRLQDISLNIQINIIQLVNQNIQDFILSIRKSGNKG